ncbi:hypothetical protein SAMN05421754_10087 [Nitrosomonas sp. Nm58]|nr:hypothetical protein SAMN05421754_10087 [Nitrosomonas sp. Nm58]
MVKERPILMSAPMVKALLDGRKTQTRRIIKPQPEVNEHGNLSGEWLNKPLDGLLLPKLQDIVIHCPFGKIGDVLWVRETWRTSEALDGVPPRCLVLGAGIHYEADESSNLISGKKMINPGKLRPSIFMPRSASRITLEITNIRAERLNDISEEDAISEGADPSGVGRNLEHIQYRAGYQYLWESINGKGSWNEDPYVWKIEFRRA